MMLATQLGSPVSAAEPTTEELSAISNYLETNDVQGLRSFLDAHPELAEGDTPLAELLRRFLVESVGGNEFFRFRQGGSDSDDSQPGSSAGGSNTDPGSAY